MHEVATSRRAVMRALALTPIIIAPAVKAAPTDAINAPVNSMTKADRTAWDAAMARYQEILAEANDFWRNVEDRADKMLERYPHKSAQLRRLIDVPAMRERSNNYGQSIAEAKDDLICTPAPTMAELVAKYDLLFGPDECGSDGYCPAWHRDTLEPFFSDLSRLAEGGRGMTDRRTFITGLALAAPVASAATGLVCIPATQHPEWLALLAEERRLDAIFDQMVDLRNDAEERYIQAHTVLTAAWQAEMDDKGGKPWKFVQARPANEDDAERTAAGIADYNAFGARMREEEKGIRDKARQEVGMADAEAKWCQACDAHMASFSAIIAYSSRDPDIIAHKMRMILDRYGDDNGDLRPLLTSIVGEA